MRTIARSLDTATRWLLVALAATCVVGAVTAVVLYGSGRSLGSSIRSTAPGFGFELRRPSIDTDSWDVMAIVYERQAANGGEDLYAPFFEDGMKFQYPPSSLLLLAAMPASLSATEPDNSPSSPGRRANATLRKATGIASWAATMITMLLSVLILEIGLRRVSAVSTAPGATAIRLLVAFALACTFYPLVKGHSLGQLQVFLNMLIAAGLLAYISDRPALSGVAFGLVCLMKPQLSLVLLWGLLRRQWPLVLGMTAVVIAGLALSVAVFGWQSHLDYVRVLRAIGERGEVFWPNQSVNGLVNRFIGNGDAVRWTPLQYAAYHPAVYWLTLLTSGALLAIALAGPPSAADRGRRAADLCVIVLVSTMASPVAWEHHYGMLLPVLAVAFPLALAHRPLGRWTGPVLLAGFVLTASVVLAPDAVFANRWSGILGSHLLFGSILVLATLVSLRAGSSSGVRARAVAA